MDSQEFLRLFEPAQKNVFFLILSIVRNKDDAEDVFQETALKACTGFKKLRDTSRFSAWLSRIAVTTAYDYLKKRRHHLDIDDVAIPYYDTYNESGEQLRRAMLTLNEEERTIVILKAVNGLPHKEIATIVRRPEGTVRTIYARAVKKLSDKLTTPGKEG